MKKGQKIKKVVSIMLILAMMMATLAGCSTGGQEAAQEEQTVSFPERDLNGYIMWGAGGAMDNMARSITPLAEEHLGRSIVLQNKTGATGAVATQFVHDQRADGYTLLYGAENPQLYGVLGISDLDYKDFEAINIFARGVGVVIVPENSEWNTVEELIEAANAAPGKIKMSSTGPGGLPFVVYSLMSTVSGIECNLVPFDGEGPATTAMLGGHVDFTIVGLSAARELYRGGKVKPLAVIANEPVEGMEEIPAIGEVIEEYQPYLPWGPFFGVFVKKETPEEVKDILKEAYKKAFEEEKFQAFVKDFGAVPMGISGKEADEFMKNWQRVSTWLLYDAGGAEISPETLGIERLQ